MEWYLVPPHEDVGEAAHTSVVPAVEIGEELGLGLALHARARGPLGPATKIKPSNVLLEP